MNEPFTTEHPIEERKKGGVDFKGKLEKKRRKEGKKWGHQLVSPASRWKKQNGGTHSLVSSLATWRIVAKRVSGRKGGSQEKEGKSTHITNWR